jgi:GPH family glycoside/pentoside/hexuronide:cation symporter
VLWYALGALPGGVGATVATFLVFYYNQVLGVPGAQIGFALMVASVFDAVTDPIVGTLSDRTRSRWGRRHPYLLGASLPVALTFFALWTPPGFLGVQGLMAWLVAVLLINRLFSTFYAVPYLALGAELTRDYEERNRVATARTTLAAAGRALSGGLLLLVFLRPTEAYPDGQMNPAGYVQFAWSFGVVIVVALLLCAWHTRSAVPRLSTAPESGLPAGGLRSIFHELRLALRLRDFRAIFFCSISKHIGWGVSDALGLYMATYFWRVGTDGLFLWGLGFFGGIFAGLAFWRRFAVGREKKPLYVLGTVAYLCFFCLPYVFKVVGWWPAEESPLHFALYVLTTGFIAHFFQQAATVMGASMLGDVTDLDESAQGRRREGIIFGAESLGWKALVGIGTLIAGFTVDAVGLAPGAAPETVPLEVSNRLGLAQGGVMTFLMAVALLFIRRYDLGRARHEEVLRRLG